MEKIFEKATRQKIRFNYKGLCTVEDLWDASLPVLDSIYVELATTVENTKVVSLLGLKDIVNEETLLKIEILKYIVAIKMEEKVLRDNATKRKEQKQKILSLIQEKQDESMRGKSVEELTTLLSDFE